MTEQGPVLGQYFRREESFIKAGLSELHEAVQSDSGSICEEYLKSFFNRVLPPKFHILNGKLIDSKKKQTDELDIIITGDTLKFAVDFEATFYQIPVESSLAIAEVKKQFKEKQLKDCERNSIN